MKILEVDNTVVSISHVIQAPTIKGIKKLESDLLTRSIREFLMNSNYMISRPKFKNKYLLRAVFGNYNTSNSDVLELSNLINSYL